MALGFSLEIIYYAVKFPPEYNVAGCIGSVIYFYRKHKLLQLLRYARFRKTALETENSKAKIHNPSNN